MPNDDLDPPVVDGEILDEAADIPNQTASSDDNAGQVLANMESLIKSHQLKTDQAQEEVKKFNDMVNNVLLNDATYQEHDKQAKEANKAKAAYKKKLLEKPEYADLVRKVKDGKASLRELREALSDYLGEYARMSGTTIVEGYDGELREIVYVAKLIKTTLKNHQ